MITDLRTHDTRNHLRTIATHPIMPRCGVLAALLLVAGVEPAPRRALPANRITARLGASNRAK